MNITFKAFVVKKESNVMDEYENEDKGTRILTYKILLEKGKKITDPTYENVTIDDCDYFLNKFSKAIKGLTYGLVQQRNPDLVGYMLLDKQTKFLSQRLDKFNVNGETKSRLLNSLF